MRVPGHDVSAVNLFVVQHLPWVGREGSAQFSAFPLTRMLLAAAHPGAALRAGLAHLLGLGEEPLTPELAETARANLRKMFHSSMSST